MKKFVIAFLSVIIAVAAAFILPACSVEETYGDTFDGYVSERTYGSEYSAVAAFISKELNGETRKCTLVDYEVGDALPADQIDEMGVEMEIIAAYPVEIRYFCNSSRTECKIKAYLLSSADGYRYFVPTPKSGEALTASYFNSVFSNPTYNNCTVNTTYSGHIFSIDSTYYQNIMFDGDKAYFKQTIPAMQVDFFMAETDSGFEYYSRLPAMGDEGYYTNDEVDAWVKRTFGSDYYFEGYELHKGGKSYDLDSFKSVSELSSFIYAANFDYTYFEKTSYGFRMPADKFRAAVYALAGSLGDDENFKIELDETLKNIDIRYYVKEGRLSRIDTVLQAIVGDSPKDIIAIEMHSEFKDFGTTKITLPR